VVLDIGEMQPRRVLVLYIRFFPLIRKQVSGDYIMTVYQGNDDEYEDGSTAQGSFQEEEDKDKFKEKNLTEICKDITDKMEEMYTKLRGDEKAWLKYVKRMVFNWHPDKNPNNEEMATEITKFIQNEAQRIWAGKPRAQNTPRGAPNFDFGADFEDLFRGWRGHYQQWDERARQERPHRERYHSQFRSNFGRREYQESRRWGVPPTYAGNDLRLARRCLEVTKTEELEGARRCLETGNYMYAAFMVRMVSFIILYLTPLAR